MKKIKEIVIAPHSSVEVKIEEGCEIVFDTPDRMSGHVIRKTNEKN